MKKIVLSALLLVAPSVLAKEVKVDLPDDGLYRCGVQMWETVGTRPIQIADYGRNGYISIEHRGVSVKYKDVNISFSPTSKTANGYLVSNVQVEDVTMDLIIGPYQGGIVFAVGSDHSNKSLYFVNCYSTKE
ncbi:TPA: hypothetical protein ACHTTK_000213 [Escherichia coli]